MKTLILFETSPLIESYAHSKLPVGTLYNRATQKAVLPNGDEVTLRLEQHERDGSLRGLDFDRIVYNRLARAGVKH